MYHVPEKYRIRSGSWGGYTGTLEGAFIIPALFNNRELAVIASNRELWEHVSVHAFRRRDSYTPTWDEMCYVKSLFWDDENVVMQLHPKKREYRNMHPNVLHLWRPVSIAIPTPNPDLVAPLQEISK